MSKDPSVCKLNLHFPGFYYKLELVNLDYVNLASVYKGID